MTWRTRGEPVDENELRSLFAEIEPPPSLDRWRERIADVHATSADPTPFTDEEAEETPGLEIRVGPGTEIHVEPGEDAKADTDGAKIRTLPTDRELRPTRRRRSVAVAAAAAVVVGLGGVVVAGQLWSDAPPADPTMIIDGPDRTRSSQPPTSSTQPPTGSQTAPNVPGTGTNANPAGEEQDSGSGGPQDGEDAGPGPGNQVSWPPMVGDPSASNTGVPVGAVLADHHGDLRITTPGQVVSDLRVTGTVIVDAQNVTLRRVIVVAAFGSPALSQNAGNLTVEDSELSGAPSVAQHAGGLSVRRSRLESGVTLVGDAQLLDNYLSSADVLVQSGAAGVLLRHNVTGQVTMDDFDGAITNVTIENGVLLKVDAPIGSGSASIHVLNNRFLGSAPSTGWDPSAPDYRWSGNTFASSGAPANP